MANSRKRDTNARRTPKAAFVAGPIALVATLAVVGVGVFASTPEEPRDLIATSSVTADISDRADDVVSRSASRKDRAELQRAFDVNLSRTATARAIKQADEHRWTTADLNVWLSGEKNAKKVGLLEAGKKVLVTGRTGAGRQEIVLGGKARWVTAAYLSASKPVPEKAPAQATPAEKTTAPAAAASCSNGTSVPSGVSPNVAKVHEAVCAAFPEITTYGTFRSDGEHAEGRAVDIMVSGDRGWQVAEFVQANAGELGVEYAIYSQKIWSVDRSGEGWRGMSDRGSTTANHYDHVHVTTY